MCTYFFISFLSRVIKEISERKDTVLTGFTAGLYAAFQNPVGIVKE